MAVSKILDLEGSAGLAEDLFRVLTRLDLRPLLHPSIIHHNIPYRNIRTLPKEPKKPVESSVAPPGDGCGEEPDFGGELGLPDLPRLALVSQESVAFEIGNGSVGDAQLIESVYAHE